MANKATGDSKHNDSPENQFLNSCFLIMSKINTVQNLTGQGKVVISSVNWRLMYLYINLGNCPVKFSVYLEC